MNCCPGSKNSINGKTARYDRIINELCHFYKVSLIKTGIMFHKYHLLNQLQVFMTYKKITKMSFNIPLISELPCSVYVSIKLMIIGHKYQIKNRSHINEIFTSYNKFALAADLVSKETIVLILPGKLIKNNIDNISKNKSTTCYWIHLRVCINK
jgi:hypothetical protein